GAVARCGGLAPLARAWRKSPDFRGCSPGSLATSATPQGIARWPVPGGGAGSQLTEAVRAGKFPRCHGLAGTAGRARVLGAGPHPVRERDHLSRAPPLLLGDRYGSRKRPVAHGVKGRGLTV